MTILPIFCVNIAFFQNFDHFFTLCCFYWDPKGAVNVGVLEDLVLKDNHGHFGDDPRYISAKIEPESEKIKIFVFF